MPLRRSRSRPHGWAVVGLAVVLGVAAGGTAAQTPLPPPYDYDEPLPEAPRPPPPWQDLTLGPAKQSYRMPVYANRKLADQLGGIQRAIVVLPGARRDASRYYQDIQALVARDPARKADTLVLALEFPNPIDAAFVGRLAWRKASWQHGAPSVQAPGRPAPISAFQVLDDVVRLLADRARLPQLSDIVLAGHGGGAQLLQRYAILNDLDGAVRRNGLGLRYVVANAPSYLYLTNERPRRGGLGYARYERGICPTYNQYPYGPLQLPAYASGQDAAGLYVRYAARDVVYLLGSADNNPEDHGLDKRCGAEAQGATRLSRGLGYLRYDRLLAGRGNRPINFQHEHQQVMGVGHESAAMFGSLCGTRTLLGDDARTAINAAACQPIAP